ncbi:MAG: ABC transporter ATP-binding protein [Clostridia bacterium]|nr:ABC transporter ATP-binding protein [Clostridia bacterium]
MNTESVGKLKVSGFSKKYGKNAIFAVEDLNFEVNSGEILGFLGPNGAGKSTTIKCIVGIQPPTKGEIEINGYDIVRQPVMAKKQLGFVPDHYALYENLTGREYLNYIADLYEVSKEDRDAKMAELLKTLNMEKAIDNQMHTYSHGMKQKMTIMASIIHNPKLWILDEPLTGLDPISIFQVKECMKDHAAKGNIVFFSSHIIDIIEKICTRIIIINNHHVAANVTLKELADKGIGLEEFYLKTIGQEIVGDEVKAVSSDKISDGGKTADEEADVKTEKDGEDK